MVINRFVKHVSWVLPAAVRSRMSLAIAVRFSGVRIDGGSAETALSKRLPKTESSSGSNTPLYCSNVRLLVRHCVGIAHLVKTFGRGAAKRSQTGGVERQGCDALQGDATEQHARAMPCLDGASPTFICTINRHCVRCRGAGCLRRVRTVRSLRAPRPIRRVDAISRRADPAVTKAARPQAGLAMRQRSFGAGTWRPLCLSKPG
ncbi:hypothetical protein J2R76_003624 [Bradyrhizobium sp. USDA 4532]|nr:hypothetical protein [Bradyrhizobium sp. USDA 4545]MCP1920033.1 hypothetical protein [Bradyrhizobium sp. USDA 4532]